MDPAHLFHVQHKEPVKPWDSVPAPVPHQQEKLNAASNILKALNPTGGLFDQPAACTIDTNSHPDAPPHPLPADPNNTSTHTLSYINELEAPGGGSAPPGGASAPEFQRNCPPHFNLRHPHSNAPPPCNSLPPLCPPAALSALRPPPFQRPPRPPAPLGPLPGRPFNTNLEPPLSKGPPLP
ncbi:hypothetical protein C0993_008926 [Termitomyces sp. T159_Od127]|nr:hypothetical protein C0993_008926 [Termitomyces sp. T159_Od127]